MDNVEVTVTDSQYCRKCPSCRRRFVGTLEELAEMFTGVDGQAFCQKCRDKRRTKNQTGVPTRAGFDLDECYETYEEFLHDSHEYVASLQPLRIRATLSATFFVDSGFSIASCAQTTDRDLQKRAVMLLRSDIFDLQKEYFECQGELQISFSQANASATLIYEHIGYTESRKFRMTGEVRNYIASHKYLAPRQIYQNMIQMSSGLDFEKDEAHVVTRQQVYNFWLSLTKGDWQRDADDNPLSSPSKMGMN
ncbi:hypothetical protein V1523DRAFT_417796 [Lipomyces doorenjongii]